MSLVEDYYKKSIGSSLDSDSLLALGTAIKPFMQVIFGLHLQEAEYHIELVFAKQPDDDSQKSLDATEIEDVHGEESGVLQASLFPKITKEVVRSNNMVSRLLCVSDIRR